MRTAFALLLVLCTGCYDKHEAPPPPAKPETVSNVTLRRLYDTYAGAPFEVANNLCITGTVTTSDRADNFYRTFCIEQEGAGVEIMAGTDHLFNTYPIGCRVTVQLRGLTIGMQYGVLQIGHKSTPGSSFPTGYIGSPAALNQCVVRTSEALAPPQPSVGFAEALSPRLCGTLIRIAGLHYAPESLEANTWAGYKRFTNARGDAVYAYTRAYARWAKDPIPIGDLALTGILQYDDKTGYTLKIRDEDDFTN